MGKNTNRMTKEKCVELFNDSEDRESYELLDVVIKECGVKEKSNRYYIKVRCKKCDNIFDSQYYNWKQGKRCKRCACREIHKDKAYNTDDAIRITNDRGYKYISGKCKNARDRIVIEDGDGYKYNPRLIDLIRRNGAVSPFKTSNPFTIDNIKKYCDNNKTKTVLLDEVYVSNTTKMRWKCEGCGEIFERDWAKFSSYSAFVCKKCSAKITTQKQKMDIEDVKKIFIDKGLIPLFDKCNKNNEKLKCMYPDGYFGYISYSCLQDGNMPRKFGKENIYTVSNIKKYLEDSGSGLTLVSTEYKGNDIGMDFKCKCGNTFKRTWACVQNRNSYLCIDCSVTKRADLSRNNYDYVKQCIENNGYVLLSKRYGNLKTKLVCRDRDGYLYYGTMSSFISEYKPLRFAKYNTYTIRNLKHYIKINNINCKIISDTYVNRESYLEFTCAECGDIYEATIGSFLHNNQTRCSKCTGSKSYYEYLVEKLLIEKNISYVLEHTFEGCKNKSKLRFDFFLDDMNVCIEADGVAHFEPIRFGGKSEESAIEEFRNRKALDRIKDTYCLDNNIKLIRVPYWEFTNNTYVETIERSLNII